MMICTYACIHLVSFCFANDRSIARNGSYRKRSRNICKPHTLTHAHASHPYSFQCCFSQRPEGPHECVAESRTPARRSRSIDRRCARRDLASRAGLTSIADASSIQNPFT